jgi:DNA-directed RNA polymerase subunit N (RpoN/RPB10)
MLFSSKCFVFILDIYWNSSTNIGPRIRPKVHTKHLAFVNFMVHTSLEKSRIRYVGKTVKYVKLSWFQRPVDDTNELRRVLSEMAQKRYCRGCRFILIAVRLSASLEMVHLLNKMHAHFYSFTHSLTHLFICSVEDVSESGGDVAGGGGGV